MKQQETNSDFLAVHEDVVKRVLDKQPAEEELYDLAELFKVFGDSTRIRILHALLETEKIRNFLCCHVLGFVYF